MFARLARIQGWTYTADPGLECLGGAGLPPFWLGLRRRVSERVAWTSRWGGPSQVIRYTSDFAGGRFAHPRTMAMIALPGPVPPAYVLGPGRERRGATGTVVPAMGRIRVVADDAAYGHLIAERLVPLLAGLASRFPVDLSLDGHWLVADVGDSTDVPTLLSHLDAVEQVAGLVATLGLPPGAHPPDGQRFYRRPDLLYWDEDPSLQPAFAAFGVVGHRFRDVVRFTRHGMQVAAVFRISDDSGSDGSSTSAATLIGLPFRFTTISVGYRGPTTHRVRAAGLTLFATDDELATALVGAVTGLLAAGPYPRLHISGTTALLLDADGRYLDGWTDRLGRFFRIVPDAVWQRLGYRSNPVPR